VLAKMVDIVRILRRSIAQGIAGTEYGDRVLGHQSGKFNHLMKRGGCSMAVCSTALFSTSRR